MTSCRKMLQRWSKGPNINDQIPRTARIYRPASGLEGVCSLKVIQMMRISGRVYTYLTHVWFICFLCVYQTIELSFIIVQVYEMFIFGNRWHQLCLNISLINPTWCQIYVELFIKHIYPRKASNIKQWDIMMYSGVYKLYIIKTLPCPRAYFLFKT